MARTSLRPAGRSTGIDGLNQPEGVTASEMLRLNFGVDVTLRDDQSPFGVPDPR